MESQHDTPTSDKPVIEEPSVLDYVIARLKFWQPTSLHLPDEEIHQPQTSVEQTPVQPGVGEPTAEPEIQEAQALDVPAAQPRRFPWMGLTALTVAFAGQYMLKLSTNTAWIGAALYALAAILTGRAYLRGDWTLTPMPDDRRQADSQRVSFVLLSLSLVMGLVAFYLFGSARFTAVNVTVWAGAIGVFLMAVWRLAEPGEAPRPSWLSRVANSIKQMRWSQWTAIVLVTVAVVLFFRLAQLDQVPSEMVSDHAEKLLDVSDVLNGQTSIFFPRNTGREAFQFYLTAVVAKLFGTGLSFMSLKIGTVLAGLVTLIYIYLLGKEVGNKWVGLLALALCGVAYWPNIISRIGLRFPLYPLFAAPALYYLMRGLRTSNRNDFLLAGLAVGLGLHGYTSFRIVPFVVVAAVAIYALHRQAIGNRKQALIDLVLLAAVALFVFLPLLRYTISFPDLVLYRSETRLGSLERPLPGPALVIFLQNLWNAMIMFFWSDGDVWVHSIPFRPALDLISAGLFFCGLVLVSLRYWRQRRWQDLFLILSIPMLMLPSSLSLAFPGENPSLNRTAAAYIPVFVIIAIALEGLLASLAQRLGGRLGKSTAWVVGLALFAVCAAQNYDLVFNQYKTQYTNSAMNTSEAGNVIRGFVSAGGQPDEAWVVAFPYWLDTRLVGINAGYPMHDTAIWPKDIPLTNTDGGAHAKLFVL
ncbi:MAG TPA: glycosyltransferase family 39 protein, partial [Anaerolineaceae bacterium]|nr:glycosyltransferase family 39 protein [Anaerolineaceae bacterium]